MTELEKLDAGLEYDFWDEGVNERKLRAIRVCQKLNAMPQDDEAAREPVIRELLGAAGENPSIGPNFQCDYGLHITVGKNFLANYNVTILDIAPVKIGDYVMIGPNTLITTVGHPLSPLGRRKHLGKAEPVIIGDDVWMGGQCDHPAGGDHWQQCGGSRRGRSHQRCAKQLRGGRRACPGAQGVGK